MELFAPVWKILLDFAVVAGIVWLIRQLTILVGRRAQDAARDWPIAQGTVEHAGPKMVGEGRTGYWVGELAYSYSVNGEYYAGVWKTPASSEESAHEMVRGWKDRRIQIRYMPVNPGRSILILDEQVPLPPAST